MQNDDEVIGSSKSLSLTITEIMDFLGDTSKRPNVGLRAFLHEKLADLSVYWYKRGVRRGRIESYKEWKATDKLSKKFRYKATGKLFYTGQERSVRVRVRSKA
jgi:hypothetical protein